VFTQFPPLFDVAKLLIIKRKVGGSLWAFQFPPPIKLTTTIKLKYKKSPQMVAQILPDKVFCIYFI
jgi:hypothetical protein